MYIMCQESSLNGYAMDSLSETRRSSMQRMYWALSLLVEIPFIEGTQHTEI